MTVEVTRRVSEYPAPIVEFLGGEPTPEQWARDLMPLEPYVLVAGAGSGKTSVMAARVIYLAIVATGRWHADHAGVMPGNVLCLTFTNKATENLIVRIRDALRTLQLEEGEEPEILELPRLRRPGPRAPRDARGFRAGRAHPDARRNARRSRRGCSTA